MTAAIRQVFKFVSKLTNDRGASRQFELLEFQFEIITEILCVKRRSDGKRKHREAHINIPRKNGKSFLAAIINYMALTIKSGAVYGGLSSTRGKAVPAAQLGGKRHTVDKVQTNKGVQEAKLKGINSWVAVASLTAV